MTDVPFRLRLLRALTDALKEITVANGYQSDLADFVADDGVTLARVCRGRAWYGDDDPIPLVSILEAVDPADEIGEAPPPASTGQWNWSLIVQGFVQDDPTNPTDPAQVLLADVRRRLAVERSRKADGSRSRPAPLGFGDGPNRVEEFGFGLGVCRPADDVSAKAWFVIPVSMRIVEDASRPYD